MAMSVHFSCECKQSQAISINVIVSSQHNEPQFQDETDIFIRISYQKTQFRVGMSLGVLRSNQKKKKTTASWLCVSDHCELNASGISEGTAQVDCLAGIRQHLWLHLHSLTCRSQKKQRKRNINVSLQERREGK